MKILQVMALAVLAIAAAGGALAQDEKLRIGMAGPLTGPNAWLGEETERGVKMAVQDLNAAGGLLGRQIEVVTADDYCDGEQAVAAANKLVAYEVAFVAGHQCSGAAIPASKVYEDAGILMISNSATNPRLTEDGGANVFRVCGRDDQQGVIAGDYLADHYGDQNIAILHDGEAYGIGLAQRTKQRLNERGIVESIFQAIEPGKADYLDVVDQMKSLGIDVLYYGGYAPEAGLLIRQARSRGSELRLIAGDGTVSQDFPLIAGPAGDGTLVTSIPDPRTVPGAAAIVDRERERSYEAGPSTLTGYAAIQAWAQAVEQAGTLELDAVIEALRSREFDTVLGRIGFDAKGDVTGYHTFAWYVWQDGDYVPADVD